VYELQPSAQPNEWNVTTIHSFGGVPQDGAGPTAPVILGRDGALYGTTFIGGTGAVCQYPGFGGCGTVFKLTPPSSPGQPWEETILYNFTGSNGDGAYPRGPLVAGPGGVLYGATAYGGDAGGCTFDGATGCGTVFRLDPPAISGGAWTETILHDFSGSPNDGAVPLAGLAISPDGALFGTTLLGGSHNLGTVFQAASK